MIRGLSGRVVLLVLAIVFVAALFYTRTETPKPEDPTQDAIDNLQQGLGMKVDRMVTGSSGLAVLEVAPRSLAEQLGLRPGDRVLSVNERSVWHAKQLDDYITEGAGKGPLALLVKNGKNFRMVAIGPRMLGGEGPAGAPGRGGPGRGGPGRAGRGGAGPAGRGAPGPGAARGPARAPAGAPGG